MPFGFIRLGEQACPLLEKLIYVADMIEPGRDFPGVEQLREIAEESIDKAMEAAFISRCSFLYQKSSGFSGLD